MDQKDENIILFILLNYYDSIKIKDIADFLNVNVNYLSSAFKVSFVLII